MMLKTMTKYGAVALFAAALLALGCSSSKDAGTATGDKAAAKSDMAADKKAPAVGDTMAAKPAGPQATSKSARPDSADSPKPTLVAQGAVAPDFTAPAHDGTTVQMSKLAGQPVVLYFYPKDNTPG